MNEDHSETAAPDEPHLREIGTGVAPPGGAPGPVRTAPRRRPGRGESGEGGRRLNGSLAGGWLAALALVSGPPALACNPAPPVPPVMEGHGYDETARETLLKQSPGIAVARYSKRLDLTIGEASSRPDYVFEVTEGWRGVAPRRLVIGGYWISCELELRPGGHYLLYLEGARPLHILPAEEAATEVEALGDLDWFYDQHGTLIRPELVNEVGGPAGAPPEGEER